MFAVPANTVAAQANPAAAHPVRIAIEYAAARDRWAHLLRYDPDERFAALIGRVAQHEVWLMSWLPGQHTDLHDHGGATGAFTVVTGRLTELVPKRLASGRPVNVLHAVDVGRARAFGPNYVHQVRNDAVDPAVSIHVYTPHRAMTRYLESIS